jgi:hypothetical protein
MAAETSGYSATIVMPLRRQVDRWLEKSIRSALDQTVKTQVLVVTARATPPSNLRIVEQFRAQSGDLRAMIRDQPESFPGAINTGIRAANSERVGILLTDDWLEPDTVALCLEQTADIVSTGNTVHCEDERIYQPGCRIPTMARFRTLPTLEAKAEYLKHFFLFRRQLLLDTGGLDESLGNSPGIDDYDLIWTLLEGNASVAIVEKPLYHIRDHQGERLTRGDPEKMAETFIKILHKHGVPEGKAQELLKEHSLWFGKSIREVIESHRRLPRWKRFLSQWRDR